MASILVVEDEPTVLVLGESVLQRAGLWNFDRGNTCRSPSGHSFRPKARSGLYGYNSTWESGGRPV